MPAPERKRLVTARRAGRRGGSWWNFYLSVGLLHVSQEIKAALVSLPVEADSGAHRVWVKLESLKGKQGALA
jgi:hypothetical protein